MPSSTSFHVGICTFSLFFPLGVYVCVCVKGNFVILLVSEGGFLQKTKKKEQEESATWKPPQNNENWFCYFAYFRRLSSWLRPFGG